MKIDFYHEALSQEVKRFTIIGIQIGKEKQMPSYLTIWLCGLGLRILF